MKTKILIASTISSLITFHSALGQGSLTPPGPPGPTMLTLSQVEPRTPISGPYTITQPGSYYLTTNVVASPGNSGILIFANNVRLDLNGFTISGTSSPAFGYGIFVGVAAYVTNIAIINGFISSSVTNSGSGSFGGNGFRYGIYGAGFNVQVKNISVSGCLYDGINVFQNSTVVEGCSVNTAGGTGIDAQTVLNSTAVNCGAYGIVSRTADNCYGLAYNNDGIDADNANNCQGQSNFGGYGLHANDTAINCGGTSSSGYGLYALTANNCWGSSSSGDGLVGAVADNCYGTSSSGTGLFVDNANNCFGSTTGGGYGVFASYIATGCYGSSSTGTGIYAFIASVCHGTTGTGTALSTSHNVNSF